MVATRGGSGSSSSLGFGSRQLDQQMREFISSMINRNILEHTPVIFGTIKEGIMEVLEERLGSIHFEMVALVGARTLTFRDFRPCGAPEFFGEKDPISSRHWLADVANAYHTSSCIKEAKVRLASCLLKDRARD